MEPPLKKQCLSPKQSQQQQPEASSPPASPAAAVLPAKLSSPKQSQQPVNTIDLEVPWASFQPETHPWPAGSPVPYLHLAGACQQLKATTKRLAKETILVNMFRSILIAGASAAEVSAACYLCSPAKDAQTGGHRLRPDWEGTDVLGVGGKSINSAILSATGATQAQFRKQYSQTREASDAGLALQQGGGMKQRLLLMPAALSITAVYQRLLGLATMSGAGSEKRKVASMAGMLRAGRGTEPRWLVRTLEAHLGVHIHWHLRASICLHCVHPYPKLCNL